MRFYALAFGAAILIALLVSLTPAQRSRQRVSPRISIEKEAEQQAVKYWKSVFTQCGDSYYTKMYVLGDQSRLSPSRRGYWIFQFRGISIKTEGQRTEQHLTEKDILNGVRPARPGEGIEWTGRANVWYRVGRRAKHFEEDPPGKIRWEEWEEWTITRRMVNFDKTDGKWRFFPEGAGDVRYVAVKCDLSDVETAGISP